MSRDQYIYRVSTNISPKFDGYDYTHIWHIWKYVASILRWSRLFQPCPAAGTFEMAAKPLGTSANFKPADGDK